MRPALVLVLVLLALTSFATASSGTADQPLSRLRALPADSVAGALRRLEQQQARTPDAGETAFLLGQFHFARGEYRQAAETFARAAARLGPERKSDARYWQGLALLAVQQSDEARGVLTEVAAVDGPRRSDAALGVAWSWEQLHRPDRALEVLGELLEQGAGEAGPAALEHTVALAGELGQSDRARRARDRLLHDYPKSVEAARVAPAASPPARGTGYAVQIGAFGDLDRARALADRARRAGFDGVQVVTRGDGSARINVVEIGGFANRDDAARAGVRAASTLDVRYQLESGR